MPTPLGAVAVDPRDAVSLMIYATHRHQDHWSDPERFDPARFNPHAGTLRSRDSLRVRVMPRS